MSFEDIGSYSDDQVRDKIHSLSSNKEFLSFLNRILFPKLSNFFPSLFRAYIKFKFNHIFSDCNSIKEFQDNMAPLVEFMISQSTDGFSFSGEENLTTKPTLFIGNHRDISLDPAFLNYLLYKHDKDTVRIAIGDNLLDGGFAEDLMRLNKSFIVHREIKGAKETLRKLSNLSAYINHSLSVDKESVWIAQREGRANDGNDFSDEAVLKMLYLSERKNMNLNEWIKSVNLTPISISYEYDPLDIIKATGWDHHEDLTIEEINASDLDEMVEGIFGYKGRVHLHIGKPIEKEVDNTEELARTLEDQIIENYHLWPSNLSATKMLKELENNLDLDSEYKPGIELDFLAKRFSSLSPEIRKECLLIYSRPYLNKKKGQTFV